eukprot:4141015-Karenia_brevis.AAC.1
MINVKVIQGRKSASCRFLRARHSGNTALLPISVVVPIRIGFFGGPPIISTEATFDIITL